MPHRRGSGTHRKQREELYPCAILQHMHPTIAKTAG
nr:MAG TPA: hypothetical protein [Caudoviricetes sp.]DAL39501.1 MAG TPA_asm: hypothetical protein [Caudoviricetes sp.]DAZ17786.1 MAG TPA: hypothetical protein [Caudoviricetes sp.]